MLNPFVQMIKKEAFLFCCFEDRVKLRTVLLLGSWLRSSLNLRSRGRGKSFGVGPLSLHFRTVELQAFNALFTSFHVYQCRPERVG
jgi:hypothetical protein